MIFTSKKHECSCCSVLTPLSVQIGRAKGLLFCRAEWSNVCKHIFEQVQPLVCLHVCQQQLSVCTIATRFCCMLAVSENMNPQSLLQQEHNRADTQNRPAMWYCAVLY